MTEDQRRPGTNQQKSSKNSATNQQQRIEINARNILSTCASKSMRKIYYRHGLFNASTGSGPYRNILLFIVFIFFQKSASTLDTKEIVKCSWASHGVMRLLNFDFCGTLDPIRQSFYKCFEKNYQKLGKRDFLFFTFAIIENDLIARGYILSVCFNDLIISLSLVYGILFILYIGSSICTNALFFVYIILRIFHVVSRIYTYALFFCLR